MSADDDKAKVHWTWFPMLGCGLACLCSANIALIEFVLGDFTRANIWLLGAVVFYVGVKLCRFIASGTADSHSDLTKHP